MRVAGTSALEQLVDRVRLHGTDRTERRTGRSGHFGDAGEATEPGGRTQEAGRQGAVVPVQREEVVGIVGGLLQAMFAASPGEARWEAFAAVAIVQPRDVGCVAPCWPMIFSPRHSASVNKHVGDGASVMTGIFMGGSAPSPMGAPGAPCTSEPYQCQRTCFWHKV